MTIRFALLLALTMTWACSQQLSERSHAAQGQAWQPYRIVPAAPVREAEPAQYLVEEPYSVVSDLELEQMRVPCCPDPWEASTNQLPPFLDSQYVDPVLMPTGNKQDWNWHVLPGDVIWHSYWAGTKEARTSGAIFEEFGNGVSLLDVSLGGRASLFRYGTTNNGRPEGWELQVEGASQLRLNLDANWDLEAVDFRFGIPIIYGRGRQQWKFSYYHLSAHLGDERIIRQMSTAERINFSRDTLVLGYSFFPRPAWRLYGEAGWAFYEDEFTEPWEFQLGVDYAQPGPTGFRGTPFFAINGHLREEVNFGGNVVAQLGWLWRGQSGRVMRTGLHYYNGKSNQFEFANQFEQQVGVGLWYDH